MPLEELVLIAAAGVLSGALNVLAGGGSLLVMPLLLELGFSGPGANGTARVGILSQNAAAAWRFRRGGLGGDGTSARLLLAALPGAALGALVGTRLDGPWFRWVLAGVMAGVLLWMVAGWLRKPSGEGAPSGANAASSSAPDADPDAGPDAGPAAAPPALGGRGVLAMVAVGFYGGFIQAGVGFLIMAVLARVLSMSLVHANAHKVWIVGAYTVIALGVFAASGAVVWTAGAALAVGTAAGGVLGARLTLQRGEKLVRVVYAVALVGLIVRLLLTSPG